MKITDVKALTLKGYKQWNYVRIETDEGLTGLGEAHPGAGIAEIILQFRNTLVGTDPRNIEPLYNRLIGSVNNRYGRGFIGYRRDRNRVVGFAWKKPRRAGLSVVGREVSGAYSTLCRCWAWRGKHAGGLGAAEREKVSQDGYQAIKFDIDNSANELKQDAVNRELSSAEFGEK